MLDYIAHLGAWAWIIFGVILIGLEMVAPGIFRRKHVGHLPSGRQVVRTPAVLSRGSRAAVRRLPAPGFRCESEGHLRFGCGS